MFVIKVCAGPPVAGIFMMSPLVGLVLARSCAAT